MTHDDNADFIGKSVKDIYGSYMGKIAGTMTEIDGSIQSVGVDCGSAGLRVLPYEQLVMQGDVVIFIPKWRLDSQRLIREKKLTLRRLRAMIEIIAGNDEMRADAEIIQGRYSAKLDSLQVMASELDATLDQRLVELREQSRSAKMLFFDAKIQYKSNEIPETTFESVRLHTGALIEHASHEITEIDNIKERLGGLETEVREVTELMSSSPAEFSAHALGSEAAVSGMQEALPEAPLHVSPAAGASSTGGMVTTSAPLKEPLGGSGDAGVLADTTAGQKDAGAQAPAFAAASDAGSTSEPAVTGAAAAVAGGLGGTGASDTAEPADMQSAGRDNGSVMATAAAAMAGAESGIPAPNGATETAGMTPGPLPESPQPAGSGDMASHGQTDGTYGGDDGSSSSSSSNGSYGMAQPDSEIIFPEPPGNTAQGSAPPKNDDDWLSRMESQ